MPSLPTQRQKGLNLNLPPRPAPSLPPDPEGLNTNRAQWALAALKTFVAQTGCDLKTEAVGDLLSNLMHYCDRSGEDFGLMLYRARNNYSAEISSPYMG